MYARSLLKNSVSLVGLHKQFELLNKTNLVVCLWCRGCRWTPVRTDKGWGFPGRDVWIERKCECVRTRWFASRPGESRLGLQSGSLSYKWEGTPHRANSNGPPFKRREGSINEGETWRKKSRNFVCTAGFCGRDQMTRMLSLAEKWSGWWRYRKCVKLQRLAILMTANDMPPLCLPGRSAAVPQARFTESTSK